ncbi:cytochrome oxidase assembly protein 1 [Marasmius crinis-equi]|uniref:Cytochrome oxidase assembly protein 1 n=1 Tax=Marasmius crinis-equi TaxID=585013 RepID=A0ABR3F8B2_9AGAR
MSAVTSRYLFRSLKPSFRLQPSRIQRRTLKTDASRSAQLAEEPTMTLFAGTSKPRPYSAYQPTPRLKRDLPRLPRRWPFVVAFALVGVTGWAGFMTVVANKEKLTSSVFKQVMRTVRSDPKVHEVLGDAIRPQPEWWLNGDPDIRGQISTMQGNVDMSFRIRGSKGSGTVYFTSIRREKGVPFTILRFKVIGDDGTVIHVESGAQD